MTAIRVALIDDHQLFRQALKAVLGAAPGIQVVGEASDADQALRSVEEGQAEVVVLDLMLPGVSGVSIARELTRRTRCRVLALSMAAGETHVADALAAGVHGYACKTQPIEELIEAIRTVAAGGRYLAPQVSGFASPDFSRERRGIPSARSPVASLTGREREVFELTVTGLTTRAIAERLVISPRTVETHRSRILRKLDARSAVDLVRIAASAGLLSP